MDALYDVTNNNAFDETTKMRAHYGILKSAAKFKFFRPTFKQYLRGHVRSRFLYINPSEWDIALFLPVAQWEKKSQRQVWAASKKIIEKYS